MPAPNKSIVTRLYSEIARGNLDVIDELLATDFVEHEVVPGLPPTRDGVRQMFTGMRTGFPDFEIVVEDMIAEGDKVVVRGTMRGTQKGVFMGIPASGKAVNVPLADFFRLREGRVVEHWGVSDLGSMMQQLGTAGPA
jgi:steroid delta-isomerase-like uncharacterized protein